MNERNTRLRRDFPQGRERLVLAAGGGQIERAAQPNHRGHRLRHQRIEGGAAHHLKHLPGLLGAWPDVAAGECIRMLQPAVFRRRLRGGVLRNCLCRIQSVL